MTRSSIEELQDGARVCWVALHVPHPNVYICVEWEHDEPQPKPHQYLTGLRTMRQEYERAVQAQDPILQRALLVRDAAGRERWFSFQDATHPSWWPEGYSPYTQ